MQIKSDLRLDIRRIKIIKKTIFEQMGGTYTKVGDYYFPNLLPDKQEEPTYRHMGTATPTVHQATPQGAIHQSADKW